MVLKCIIWHNDVWYDVWHRNERKYIIWYNQWCDTSYDIRQDWPLAIQILAWGGDKGPMQGCEWCVIRDKIKWTKKISVNLWLWAIFLFKHNILRLTYFFSIFWWGDPSQLGSLSKGCVKPLKLCREAIWQVSYHKRIHFMARRLFFVFLFFSTKGEGGCQTLNRK